MKLIEFVKLKSRTLKYKYKNDKGGIAYVESAIKNGQTVLDIGAHKAGYLYFMLQKVGKQGRVFAFEPQTILYQYIKSLKTSLNWNNVTLERPAAWLKLGI